MRIEPRTPQNLRLRRGPLPTVLVTLSALALASCGGSSGGECHEGSLPVAPTPAPEEATCSEPLSATATQIRQDFLAQGLARLAVRGELLDPANIHVVLCGTGTPVPSARAQACTAVFAGGKFLLFDSGDGAVRSIESLDLPLAELDAVFLTHFHSDHIADVGEVISRSWILGRTTPLTVYGGEAVERVVGGFNRVYALDDVYREAHHGAAAFPIEVARAEVSRIDAPSPTGQLVYDQDGVTVTAFAVDHAPIEPALGYRVEYMGKVVGISGDTIRTPGLVNLAQGADILVSEAMNEAYIEQTECALDALPAASRTADIFRDIRTYHIDVAELAQLAQDAGVRTLALTHLVPTPTDAAQADLLFTAPAAALFTGTLVTGEDGARITIPAN